MHQESEATIVLATQQQVMGAVTVQPETSAGSLSIVVFGGGVTLFAVLILLAAEAARLWNNKHRTTRTRVGHKRAKS